jgi:hypothetical protein
MGAAYTWLMITLRAATASGEQPRTRCAPR